ncbi:PRK06851 family protein [Clostridium ganghwense]|uniref:PRK06851 family protein n=1 Tax=Clostridium ganghwense TaxID=312089 RepID=A0ABT4CQJ5_9CLOT|nr:PRK06851 family protein [Clostridium ganghwense]MCY6371193.1 PRK06851 family protein [Clostridium ganghwense]
MKGEFKHFFPGGNTSKGFYSFYRYILPQETARRIICIKGGPGTGKSSLMKRVGQYFNEKGYDIEYHHCSSDNTSLDGVVIKELNVALLDGTSPHVVDPINPGAVDEILNMGDCWIESGFKDYRSSIISTNKQVGKKFKHAYRYIGASRLIHDDWSSYNSEALNASKLNNLQERLKNDLFKNTDVSIAANSRHLFATAFTPNGIVTFIDSIYKDYKHVYVLNGGPGTGKTSTLQYLYKKALKRGLYVEVYHDPLVPERIEHICIPNLSTAILTSNEINERSFAGNQINMEDLQNKILIDRNKAEIEKAKENFNLLLNKGLKLISEAKALHDELEKYYIPNMDFDKVEKTINDVITKILKYEKEYKNK